MSKISRGSLAFSLLVSILSILLGKPLLADALGGLSSPLDPLVAINPPELVVDPGDTFTVEVVIKGASNLGGYEFKMDFDPRVVQVVDAEDGGFLGSTGRTLVPLPPIIGNDTFSFGAVSVGDQPGPDGDGTLAIITLEAIGGGVTELDLHDVKVLDVFSGEMPEVTVEDGLVQVGAWPTPTEAVTATPTGTPAATATGTPTVPGATPTEATPTEAMPTETPSEVGTPAPTGVATATSMPTEAMPTATPTETGKPTPTSTPAPPALTLTATPLTPKPAAYTPTPSSYPSETKGKAGGNPPLLIAIGLAGIVAIALAALWGKKLWSGQ